MSLILDALNRAERERGELQPAVVSDEIATPVVAPVTTPARSRKPALAAALGSVVLAAALGWWMLGGGNAPAVDSKINDASADEKAVSIDGPTEGSILLDSETSPALTPMGTEVAINPSENTTQIAPPEMADESVKNADVIAEQTQQLASAAAREVATLYEEAEREADLAQSALPIAPDAPAKAAAVAALYKKSSAPRPIDSMAVAAPERLETQVSLPPSDVAVPSGGELTRVEEPAVASMLEPSPEPVPELPPEIAALGTLAQLHNIIWFNDLSWQTRLQIPSINYAAHVVTRKPASVTINGAVVQAGQRAGDFEVEVIAADGVVLKFGETRFKLAALNGWINI